MFSHDELIQIRQNEIFNEVQDIDDHIRQLCAELEKLEALKKRRLAEYDLLQRVSDKGLVDNRGQTTRLSLEAALKRIFDKAGRPLSIGELIGQLREFGYMYDSLPYHTAYSRIRALGILEPTGARGYYNLLR